MDSMDGRETRGALRAVLIAIFILLAALSAASVYDQAASEGEGVTIECC